MDFQDGIKITIGQTWAHVRPSNTEPVIRLVAEAPSREELDALVRRVRKASADIALFEVQIVGVLRIDGRWDRFGRGLVERNRGDAMKRREFAVSGLAGIAAGLVAGGAEAQQKTVTAAPKSKPYGVQYYEKAVEIWNRESTSELPIIAKAADAAAKSLKNGKKLYSFAHFGHMLVKDLRIGRPGNPDYLPTGNWQTKDEDFDVIGEGDFIFFDQTKMRVKKAHDRGAFVVGVRCHISPTRPPQRACWPPTRRPTTS